MRPRWIAVIVLALVSSGAPARAQIGGWASRLVGPRAQAELSSPEGDVRMAAAARLARHGEPRRAVAALLEALAIEEDVRVRGALFGALARRGDPAAVPVLAARLEEWGAGDRVHALVTIGAIGGEAAIRVLTEWLGASDVGDVAVDALARIGAPAVPHLLRALASPTSVARAARALGLVGDTRATAPLATHLGDALPAVRVEMLDALARLGDERATPAVVARLEDPAPAVVAATLRCLARIGGPEVAAPVAALADRGTTEQRALALEALAVLDPAAAAPRLTAAIEDPAAPALLRRAAIDALLGHPSADARAPLLALFADAEHRVPAADALARVPEGAGLADLLALAAREDDPRLHAPLALALRRHGERADGALVREALARLAADTSPRGLVLSALARDEGVLDGLARGLRASEPAERASAALGLRALGASARGASATLVEQLLSEDDPRAFRALALAAIALDAPIDPARIDARWWDARTAPEALWLTAVNLEDAAPRTRARARRAMRRSLRASEPRVRAGAALALALARDRRAWPALVAALEDEHDRVRLAVARALAALGVEEAAPRVAARARVEPDPAVRATLIRASDPAPHAIPALAYGDEVLFVRVATAPGLTVSAAGLEVELLLPDGRWLRAATLPGGEVLVPDLVAGDAEVQVRLSAP